jgi:hypothetical protein
MENPIAIDKYPEHKALNPFFDVVMKGLRGLVDGEHYYDAIAEDARFEFLYPRLGGGDSPPRFETDLQPHLTCDFE